MAHCERLVTEGRRHARHRRRVDPARRPPAHAAKNWRACCRCCGMRVTLGVPVSVDTSEPAVMQAALDLGVDIVNDVRALRGRALSMPWRPSPARRVPDAHARRARDDAAAEPHYDGRGGRSGALPRGARGDAAQRASQPSASCSTRASASARARAQPGIAARQRELLARGGRCWWAGRASRRWALTGKPCRGAPGRQRGGGADGGAARRAIVRVHDVAATVDALKVWQACSDSPSTVSCLNPARPPCRSEDRTTGETMSRRYFGTDGIRGTVGQGARSRPTSCCAGPCRRAGCCAAAKRARRC
jgi:dihydropteroate synthase